MRLQRAHEHKTMPWKNGLGVTREVALAPAMMEGAPFLWRLSLATISAPGPFSALPGIDRSIAALSGDPVRLRVEGRGTVHLEPLGEPFGFAGETAIEVQGVSRATTDLNIMSLRGYATHVMKRIEWRNRLSLVGRHDVTMLVFTGPAMIAATCGEYRVDAGDVLLEVGRGEEVELFGETLQIAYMAGIDLSPA